MCGREAGWPPASRPHILLLENVKFKRPARKGFPVFSRHRSMAALVAAPAAANAAIAP